jgi:hypothetical protein
LLTLLLIIYFMERELGIEMDHLGDKYAMKVADVEGYSQRGRGRRKHNS